VSPTLVSRVALVGAILMFCLTGVSAYLRLAAAGTECEPWPQCYARAPLSKESRPHPVARLCHRLLAAGIGIVVLLLAAAAFAQREERPAQLRFALAIVALTFALAVLGRGTPGAVNPLVAPANLLGGLALLSLLTWVAWDPRWNLVTSRRLRLCVQVALALIALQVIGGALLSTTHGAAACPSLTSCSGDVMALASNGLHRMLGAILLALNVAVGIQLVRAKATPALYAGIALMLLTAAQVALGAGVLTARIELAPALSHNLIAALLLATIVAIERLTAPR